MLEDKNLLVVDTRPFSNYTESHIPGAVNTDLMQFHWIDTSKSGIRQFNMQSGLLLSNIGVSKKKLSYSTMTSQAYPPQEVCGSYYIFHITKSQC
jgi:rhodanese-related sulfurtransferase